jgi:photosystem II stability/assembly factor-like uncharacterized protein
MEVNVCMRKHALAAMVASLVAASIVGATGAPPATGRTRPSPAAAPAPAAALDPVLLKALKARSIGPAVMGGRVPDIALDPRDPFTFYVALGTGGLMKTSDNGGTFKAVFEDQPVASVGAVAVAPSDSKVVWVGTGEANDRNSSSWGNGVYRSTDGGETWTQAGLTQSRTIARVVVHPTDPATAWVAAMGDLWGPGGERGCYKTTDAGQTWKAMLTAAKPYDAKVGCGDLALDPGAPDTVYAALYARQRTPWSFVYGPTHTDGQDLGGVFKTTDGGATWRKLGQGLPAQTGRIGLAVHAANPRILYAEVQSDAGGTSSIDEVRSRAGGIFRSEDGGETFTRVNALNPRPFYFSKIRVDPQNPQLVYVLGYALHVSEDGGRTFREDRFAKVHPDTHALAVDPRNPKRLLLGTDGGAYQSFNGGESWEHLSRMAAGEFYRINVDLSDPYRICGGLQDNLNWVGPSRTRTKEGILNSDWINIGGGDGFYCVFDPEDPDLVYTESQAGSVHRMNLRSGQVKQLRPEPAEGQPTFRFHWNSPLIGSTHQKGTLYLGGNRVFRLAGKGERWQSISPDLSTQDPQKTTAVGSGAENYGVVYTLAESPARAGVLWAGTDDGKVWITENDGGAWTDLTASLPAAVKGQWISRIEPGRQDAKVAYLAVDAHRTQNFAPLAYRTADGGRTWQSIAGDLPGDHPVKVVREDPRNADVLYAGTEFALFVSLDRGGRWAKLGSLPTVAVDDILVHPRDNDLVIATHGRSLYVLDDVRALQELTPEVRAKEAHLFAPRPALAVHRMDGFEEWAGGAVFRGANPPEGALLTYWIKNYRGDPVKIAVKSASGVPVAKLTGPGAPGLHRVSWDLKPTKDLLTEYGGEGSLFVPAGEYTVTLTHGDDKDEQKLKVEVAPGVETR